MRGKRLSIEELEKLPIGTVVSVERGYFNVDYKIDTYFGKLCLSANNPNVQTLYYEDILKLDVYESTREITTNLGMDYYSSTPYVVGNNDWTKKMIDEFKSFSWTDTSLSPVYDYRSYKPEMRIEREFNIAKKKENEIKPLNGNEKYKLNKARLEFLVDIALEENNKEDFIKFSSKLKKYYNEEVV